MTEAAISLGHDLHKLEINETTITRSGQKAKTTFVQHLKKKFYANEPLTVHWDGKLLQDSTSKQHVHCLPFLLSGSNIDKLLGVSKLTSATGEQQANAVADALQEWEVSEAVVSMCFDTTAANTGHQSSTCILLEQKLGRNLLHFAYCRHGNYFSSSISINLRRKFWS